MTNVADMNLIKLFEDFGTEDRCRAYLAEVRWPRGPECLRCKSRRVSVVETRDVFNCNECGYQFTVRTGTVLHDSKLPLWKWFLATLIMVESKKGVSANQLKRLLRVTYKTSWYLCHRIRAAMATVNDPQLTGAVEVDETWVGGKSRGHGRGDTGNKALVLGAVQREGSIRLAIENRRDHATLTNFVGEHVADEAGAIYTDDFSGYGDLSDKDTKHETVNHSAKEYVRGDVHTNTMESVWSLFKRSVVGSYHRLSVKHLPAYLDEMEWRFNNRRNHYLFRDTILALMTSDVLGYEKLTADKEPATVEPAPEPLPF